MKNLRLTLFVLIIVMFISACGSPNQQNNENEIVEVDEIVFVIAPIFDPELIMAKMEAVGPMIVAEMATHGFNVSSVNIFVSTSFSAAAEAVSSGTAHIASMPATTFVEYESEGISLLLLGQRGELSVDSEDPRDWNTGEPVIRYADRLASYYRATIIAGPTPYGQVLQEKVRMGQALTWSDLEKANWCVSSNTTSAAGVIYPSLWLAHKFDKSIFDVNVTFSAPTNGDLILGLATEVCDVGGQFAYIRTEFQEKWITDYKRSKSIWEETSVIGISVPILNSVLAISTSTDEYSQRFYEALQKSILTISKTEVGIVAFGALNIGGFSNEQFELIEGTREAYEFVRSQNK
jgi:phosphonate transport system substrate-binding protein